MKYKTLLAAMLSITVICCSKNDDPIPIDAPLPGEQLVQLPVVVHLIHNGEDMGQGPNLSKERVLRQIEILNEDFRRKKGTKGYNEDPNGADTQIEFVLAKFDPDAEPFDGINRIDASQKQVDELGYNQNHFAQYAYWSPEQYINIWVTPLPLETACLVLGSSTGPETDLPGSDLLQLPQPGDAEGILVNWIHFGESDMDCHARFGRTLTHEMGHYLGLLHTWGKKDCIHNDYCDDTPAVDQPVYGSTPFKGCSGETIMIGNYMNYSEDATMNIFTLDQAERMYYVLKNHSGRNSLLTSPAL
ncbi:M43 family zinc metalloprotease [Muricauda amoyensis]|uniref:M43 family zinc metalloprotease n=1 Tax=Flagellimonas amoyensis TaxID=2169401 RepID=UPI000D35DCC8|nr:M43 family zinc metalloprotease [Allomuricauda amoyensis]